MSSRLITASTGMMRRPATPAKAQRSPRQEEAGYIQASSNPANRLASPQSVPKAKPYELDANDSLIHAAVDAVFEELLQQLSPQPVSQGQPKSRPGSPTPNTLQTPGEVKDAPKYPQLLKSSLSFLLSLSSSVQPPKLYSMINIGLSRLMNSAAYADILERSTDPCLMLLLTLVSKFAVFCLGYSAWQHLEGSQKAGFGGMKDLKNKVQAMAWNMEKVVVRLAETHRNDPKTLTECDLQVADLMQALEGTIVRTNQLLVGVSSGLPRLFIQIMRKVFLMGELHKCIEVFTPQAIKDIGNVKSKIEAEDSQVRQNQSKNVLEPSIRHHQRDVHPTSEKTKQAPSAARINDFFGRLDTPPLKIEKSMPSTKQENTSRPAVSKPKQVKESSVMREHSSSYDSSGENRRLERRPATPSKQRKTSPAPRQIARNSNEKKALELIQLLQRKPVDTTQGSKSLRKEPPSKVEREKQSKEKSHTTKQRLPNGKFRKIEVGGSTSLKKTVKKEPAVALKLPISKTSPARPQVAANEQAEAEASQGQVSKENPRVSEAVGSGKYETSEELRTKLNKALEKSFQSKPANPIILADSASSCSDMEDEGCAPDKVDQPDIKVTPKREHVVDKHQNRSQEDCAFIKATPRQAKDELERDDRPCSPEASPFAGLNSQRGAKRNPIGNLSALPSEKPGAATAPLKRQRNKSKNVVLSGMAHIGKRLALSRRKQRATLSSKIKNTRLENPTMATNHKRCIVELLEEFRFSITPKRSLCEMSLLSSERPDLRKVTETFKIGSNEPDPSMKWYQATGFEVVAGMQAAYEEKDMPKPTGMQKSVRDAVQGLRLNGTTNRLSTRMISQDAQRSTETPRGLSSLLGRRLTFKHQTSKEISLLKHNQIAGVSPRGKGPTQLLDESSFLGKRGPRSVDLSSLHPSLPNEDQSCFEGLIN